MFCIGHVYRTYAAQECPFQAFASKFRERLIVDKEFLQE